MRKSVKRMLGVGIIAGAAYAAWRSWNVRQGPAESRLQWESSPFPYPPVPRADATPAQSPSAEPNDDGTCPVSHPIKAKLGSGIYHVPGGANYERTKPDRCYADESAAISDGLRRSKV